MKEKSFSWIIAAGIGVAVLGGLIAVMLGKKCKKKKYICESSVSMNAEDNDEEKSIYNDNTYCMNKK